MPITSKDGILKVLTAYNPWWKTGVVNPKMTKNYKRFAFYEAMKRLNETNIRRTVVLTGTRRVGKTTIQYQMIDALLKEGVYFNMKMLIFIETNLNTFRIIIKRT